MSLDKKRLFLLDMDGTLYLDTFLFDGALDFLNRVRLKGGRYIFLTNNSSKGTDAYINKLKDMGIDASPDDFLTSTDATALYIKQNYSNKKFYAMGTKSFVEQLKSEGINVTSDFQDDIDAVVIANDTELTFGKLDFVCRILSERDVPYIATNPDWTCPTKYGYVPDCGSFAEIIYKATGKRPYFIGKPQPEMILLTMSRYGYTKDETVMIGDRIYTDIASGFNAGIDTVLVLSGESTIEDARASSINPTYIFDSIKEIVKLI